MPACIVAGEPRGKLGATVGEPVPRIIDVCERTAHGLEVARKLGKLTGRRRRIRPETIEAARAMVAAGKAKTEICKALGVSRTR